MRIEKVNDNQIRCILTKEDLDMRQLKISEIAYGSAKAKMLFKDVMQQASYEFGFESDNIPLMIEAIPMSTGCVVFIITKVENPEELDTRFSKFAPSVIEENENNEIDEVSADNDYDGSYDLDGNLATPDAPNVPDMMDNPSATAHIEIVGAEALKEFINKFSDDPTGGVMDLFKKISASAVQSKQAASNLQNNAKVKFNTSRIFQFEDLDTVGKACKVLSKFYGGLSALYKNTEDGMFYMLLEQGSYDKKEFVKVTNLMLEYSSYVKTTDAVIAHMKEHYKCLIAHDAVSGMAQF